MDAHAALDRIAAGDLDRIEIERLHDLAGSLGDLVRLLDWLQDAGATLSCTHPPLDTATPAGRASVGLLREVAGWAPVRPPGRPGLRDANPELAGRIETLRGDGLSLQAIADRLNTDGIPTPRGGRGWRPSSVQAALGYRRPGPPGPPRPPGQPGPPPPPRERPR
jgi:DNA invertase Pin-like site-specific DNA recombinase